MTPYYSKKKNKQFEFGQGTYRVTRTKRNTFMLVMGSHDEEDPIQEEWTQPLLLIEFESIEELKEELKIMLEDLKNPFIVGDNFKNLTVETLNVENTKH